MRYFFDNCISYRYAEMLRALNIDVVALREVCEQDIKDVALLRFLANSDYIFVSEDRKQLTRVAEAAELKAAGINAIYFGPFWGKLKFWGQAEYLIRRWPIINSFQEALAKTGTVVEVKQNGKSMPVAI